jgi:ketosteroid isomerase-like protein
MSAQENKELTRRWFEEVWNKGNMDFVDEVVASNLVVHDPSTPEGMGSGVESAKQFVEVYRNAFPDIQLTVEDLIAEGDKVVTRWTAPAPTARAPITKQSPPRSASTP